MRVIALYHPHSDHASRTEQYARDFERRYGKEIELMSLETINGARMAKLYDVVRYPAIIATHDDGIMLQVWADEYLPLTDEIIAYIRS